MTEEEWRVIPKTDGLYWASNLGRIKHIAYVSKRGVSLAEKILRPTAMPDGHLQVGVFGRLWTVHKLVYRAWKGSIPTRFVVRHSDGRKANNVPGNLVLGHRYPSARYKD